MSFNNFVFFVTTEINSIEIMFLGRQKEGRTDGWLRIDGRSVRLDGWKKLNEIKYQQVISASNVDGERTAWLDGYGHG